MDYKVLKINRELVKGFLSQRIKAMQKEGLQKVDIINYYIDILQDMKNERLFEEALMQKQATKM